MNILGKVGGSLRQVRRFTWILAIVWTIVVAGSLAWNMVERKGDMVEVARVTARSASEEDVIYRLWNASHGGVYVPVTDVTQPNPYLAHIPERDVTTPSGKLLTLMNPAYMTRQVYELASEKYSIRGHLTSLNPIRPENAPDPWEVEALEAFEAGKTEISSVEEIEGEEYMRSMHPLYTEKSCLECHARQGYQEGDVRGGISISIPMKPLEAIVGQSMLPLDLGHLLLWLMGLIGIVLGTQRLRRSEELVEKRTKELNKMVNVMAGREVRMAELKDIDKQLRKQLKEAGMTPAAEDPLAGDDQAE